MSISFQVLGAAGRDNALFVKVDSGQTAERLLFDCGGECLTNLTFAEIQAVDHMFFSHLHMDHVAGFDSFFRCNYNRDSKPTRIWGPPDTARIMQHRFEGYLWNLHEQMSGSWFVSDIYSNEVVTERFELAEAFAIQHNEGTESFERTIVEGTGFVVEAATMDHRTPSIAYVVREKPKSNVDTSKLAPLGLRAGPWLKELKDTSNENKTMTIGGVEYSRDDLRSKLVVETPGNSIAYLTDFLLDESAMEALVPFLHGCNVIVCEGQYRHSDLDLAVKNYHMTTVLAATLAKSAHVEELVLFHVSDRYDRAAWLEMLREARQVFPNAHFASHWELDINA